MNEIHGLATPITVANVAIIALFAAGIAALSNCMRPQGRVADLTMFTVTVLSAFLLVFTIGLMIWFLSRPCPGDSVCDAGAMAASGIVMLGAAEVVLTLLVGSPIAYLTIRLLRSR